MADLSAGSSLHIRSYFDHFRRLFKPATKCWITVLALAYLFFLDFQAIGSLPSSMRVFFWGGVLFLVFCLLMAAAFLPPVIDARPLPSLPPAVEDGAGPGDRAAAPLPGHFWPPWRSPWRCCSSPPSGSRC